MSDTSNITNKAYKKLLMEFSMNRFSFVILDSLINKFEKITTINFNDSSNFSAIENQIRDAFKTVPELNQNFDDVLVLHQNNWNTFVPESLFDLEFLSSYLQYNTTIFTTDSFAFDAIKTLEINNVFVPFANINNQLLEHFTHFEYKHSTTILVEKLLELTKNVDYQQVFVHFREDTFEIIIAQNQKLLLCNSFEYKTKEDFIYYLLFTTEQLKLNPEHFNLVLLGNISIDSQFYEIAYTYVRNVTLLNTKQMEIKNELSPSDNLQHFILLQS